VSCDGCEPTATHRPRSTGRCRRIVTVWAVGSGLILFVIVGAWLAVLVPMFLRSHDAAAAHRTADRFGGAMRVLSHRTDAEQGGPRRVAGSVLLSEFEPSPGRVEVARAWLGRLREWAGDVAARLRHMSSGALTRLVAVRHAPAARAASPASSPSRASSPSPASSAGPTRSASPASPAGPAVRRRRTLLVLLVLALAALAGGVLGPPLLLGAHAACDLLVAAFVVHLRRQAVRRAQARRRPTRPVVAQRPAPLRVAGVPDRMPARPAPLAEPVVRPEVAVRDDDPAQSRTWEPVPVPAPMYVGKSTAPSPPRRVVDLTRPGQWSAGLQVGDGVESLENSAELDEVLDRRRAVNDW